MRGPSASTSGPHIGRRLRRAAPTPTETNRGGSLAEAGAHGRLGIGLSAGVRGKILSKQVHADDLRHHCDELRVVANRTRSLHLHPRLARDPGSLDIEII